jgi:hypothetical protein
MLKSIKLRGIGPVADLSADFGERLNILTGDNGLGKSFLLDVCFWALTSAWPGGRVAVPAAIQKKAVHPRIEYKLQSKKKTEGQTAAYDFKSQYWVRRSMRKPISALVVYAAVDGGFAVWDSARNFMRDHTTGKKNEFQQPPAFQFTPDELANGLQDENRVYCNGLIRDWVSWYYEKSSKPLNNPFQYLESVVALLAHPLEPMTCGEPKRMYVDDSRDFPSLRLPYGEVGFPHWSAGVRRVISFAYLLVWAWYEHTQAAELRKEEPTNRLILIVDEIESHLHPKWQRTILPALLEVTQKLRRQIEVQVFTATHSPLILASLEPHFDKETDKLFWFDLERDTVHFRDQEWAAQGDVVGWLTSDIFGLQQARSREAEAAIQAAEAFMRGEHENLPSHLKTKAQIQDALVKSLPGIDPFWPRWIVEAKQ